GTIVLFSDGEDRGSDEATAVAAEAAQKAGVHVETVGVGTPAGAAVAGGVSPPPAAPAPGLGGLAWGIDLRLTTHNEDLPLAGALSTVAVLLLAAGAVLTVLRTGRLGCCRSPGPPP